MCSSTRGTVASGMRRSWWKGRLKRAIRSWWQRPRSGRGAGRSRAAAGHHPRRRGRRPGGRRCPHSASSGEAWGESTTCRAARTLRRHRRRGPARAHERRRGAGRKRPSGGRRRSATASRFRPDLRGGEARRGDMPYSSAPIALRSSTTCTALMAVIPTVTMGSV